ncbi:MAG: hypothetical protein UX08_C0005G0023 [Candidatus Collierbacteria bacterium GW2011_GWB1_45_35]|uniref:Uncharacterized protein n=2 Tax=Candidatus Collieribacteriota TaxID=1752725 RepID=A0A0G1KS16_9BACT|nr:MAG: hypothetical protein UW48_C0005G0023 [Microgenomates group bacterium GW2011_GWC1_44_23]KKT86373.1 MAG: hypothetical protein UW84_C0012G0011 [Candidatus Collierbacteria bacterium GW2011_GWA2_44_99]KKT95780.1 MAG: hypothetical protein UW96_C0004G0023 [Candidatus Collierbacteria bacterium GW2011_GWA1_45_15]KKU00276.1 MAG: hypothetical protein UX01_C0006G0070 [Candidatus Collierbacteria bacterium GW2011_GWB2_45_17]KKU05497.1 MAG: hypothetical protein UX08_C0005G0023 [Candidatus Collierbacte
MEIKTIDLDKLDPGTEPAIDQPVLVVEKRSNYLTVIIFLVVAIVGFYIGASLKTRISGKLASGTSGDLKNIQAEVPQTGVKVGDIYGSADEKAFNTSATGVLDKGGLNGEGTHKLVRPGGISQTVYMTSSVIDLDTLVGHQITVWGETFKGQKAGWLMDVGRVKVENLNMPLPK